MRILHFVDRWTFGGLQTVVMELCEAQRRSGHSVEIAVREDGTNNPRRSSEWPPPGWR